MDWDPDVYARFRGPRLRPALDLLAQIGSGIEGLVCDLGCGDGAVGPALRARFPKARLTGIDSSRAMLDRARAGGAYDRLVHADAGRWRPEEPAALIFSNAALHWLPDHDRLMPHLSGLLAPGGTLAVQMPANFLASSHVLLRGVAADLWPDRFAAGAYVPPVQPAQRYLSLLAPLGDMQGWETTYLMRLDATPTGHPVRWFTQSTAMRPFLDRLSPVEAAQLTGAYDLALSTAYPAEPDGSVIFPFSRLFFLLTRP